MLPDKTMLILGGAPKELIDGVRYYANHARPQDHGHRVAAELVKTGIRIFLLAPPPHIQKIANVNYVDIKADASAADMLEAAREFLQHKKMDAIVQLATISSLKAAHISTTKLKVKKETGGAVPMEVVGNVNIAAQLCSAAPEATFLGYDNTQQFSEYGDRVLRDTLRPVIAKAAQGSTPRAVPSFATSPHGEPLAGRKIIVTSGPTVEALTLSGDIITNISSGAQGFAVAEALAAMGAEVTLVSGAASLPAPKHARITTLHTQSARRMQEIVLQQLPADAYVGVAAVADFGLQDTIVLKLKENEPHTLTLTQNPDILQTVAHHAPRPAMVIGFAAETHDVLHYANGKLAAKGADAICANAVDESSRKNLDGGNNQVTWVTSAQAPEAWPAMPKLDIGFRIGEKIAAMLANE